MDIFMMLWFFVLPILGIFSLILVPLFWFLGVPQIARMLTWARFQNTILHFIADDAGVVELVKSKELIPEGIIRTKRGWQFLPRPDASGEYSNIEKMALKIYTLKGHGKPVMLAYAGKVTSFNPATLASMQQNDKLFNPQQAFDQIYDELQELPNKYRRYLKPTIKKLHDYVKARTVTNIDISQIKSTLEGLFPPTLIDALATNRELKGMKKAGKQYTPLLLGGMIIVALLVFGVIAIFSMT